MLIVWDVALASRRTSVKVAQDVMLYFHQICYCQTIMSVRRVHFTMQVIQAFENNLLDQLSCGEGR